MRKFTAPILLALAVLLLGGCYYATHPWNGYGTHVTVDGGKYAGEFKNGKYHGQGTFINWLDRKYVGEFVNDKLHGQGSLDLTRQGMKYVGEFVNGEPTLRGKWTIYNQKKNDAFQKKERRDTNILESIFMIK